VAFFSLLIYYIGYRLRAGETEWNELHLVDIIMPQTEQPAWRGRTYASLYSSSNARYRLGSELPFSSLRSEFLGPAGGRQESARVEATLKARGFQAEVAVPVWSSLLYVSDWQQEAAAPVSASVSPQGDQYQVTVQNHLTRPLRSIWLGIGDRVYSLGDLGAGETRKSTLNPSQGQFLPEFVRLHSQRFLSAAQQRQQAFGREQSGALQLSPDSVAAASLISAGGIYQGAQRTFIYPEGTDIAALLQRGQAVLFAWDGDHGALQPGLPQFTPPRISRNTMYRLAIPVAPPRG
jgi:hypothetical protein